jgi:hypothetical protein
MHVDLSFSYLRFAEAASFDKKELRRSCTNSKITEEVCGDWMREKLKDEMTHISILQ